MEELSVRFHYMLHSLFLRFDPNFFVATIVNFSWLYDTYIVIIFYA